MLSILHEKEIFNNKLRNRYVFLEIKVNCNNSQSLQTIYDVKDFLQRKLDSLTNREYDHAFRITIFSQDNLMIYLITQHPRKRPWETQIRELLGN